jgi:hypothetical protein
MLYAMEMIPDKNIIHENPPERNWKHIDALV